MPAPATQPIVPLGGDLEQLMQVNPEARYQLKIIVLERLLRDAKEAEQLLRERLAKYEPEPEAPPEG